MIDEEPPWPVDDRESEVNQDEMIWSDGETNSLVTEDVDVNMGVDDGPVICPHDPWLADDFDPYDDSVWPAVSDGDPKTVLGQLTEI